MQKTTVTAFVIGLVLGVTGAGLIAYHRTGGDLDWFTGEYRASQQRAAEAVTGLERTIGEQRERIDNLEASNSRLEDNIRSARGICESALGGSEKAAGDIRSAIELSKTLATALKDINRILNSGDTSDGPGNVDDL
jgi:hypothetical protein